MCARVWYCPRNPSERPPAEGGAGQFPPPSPHPAQHHVWVLFLVVHAVNNAVKNSRRRGWRQPCASCSRCVEVSFGINERSLDLLDMHSIVVGTTLSSRKACVQKVGSAYPIVIVVIEDGSTQTIRQSIDNKAIELLVICVPRRQSRFGLTDCSRVGDSDVTTWRAGGTDWRRHNRLGLLAG